jgi:hypothetical protein
VTAREVIAEHLAAIQVGDRGRASALHADDELFEEA